MIEFELERLRFEKRLSTRELSSILGMTFQGVRAALIRGTIRLEKIRLLEERYGDLTGYFKKNHFAEPSDVPDRNMDIY